MGKPALNLYVVAPEASGFNTRRLKGNAHAYGLTLHVVDRAAELPSIPMPHSILITPDTEKPRYFDNHDEGFQKIFLLTDRENALSCKGSAIFAAPGPSNPAHDTKLLAGLLLISEQPLKPAWHAIETSGRIPLESLPEFVRTWSKSCGTNTLPIVRETTKWLSSIPNQENSRPAYRASCDGHSWSLEISFPRGDGQDWYQILRKLHMPSAHTLLVHRGIDHLSINIQAELTSHPTRQIMIINTDDTCTQAQSAIDTPHPREAS